MDKWIQEFNLPPHSADGYWQIKEEQSGLVVADLAEHENIDQHARLIAAAPDMLAALNGVVIAGMADYRGDPTVMAAALTTARAAIAKARGQ